MLRRRLCETQEDERKKGSVVKRKVRKGEREERKGEGEKRAE